MGILQKIRRHAAIGAGNFAAMFKDGEIPPLPAAVARLIAEINNPQPEIDRLATLISGTPCLAAKVIRTVNSSLFPVRRQVTNVKHAVTLLGLRHIRSIALAYAAMEALPRPAGDLFDHEAFWNDSLLQALLARSFAAKKSRGHADDVFTATLLADGAIPLLLCCWEEYYTPIIEEWQSSSRRLSEIERANFGWDHAQAGAWIVQSWGFPEEMVCYIGSHNLDWETLRTHGLEDTPAVPVTVAALTASVLKNEPERAGHVVDAARDRLGMSAAEVAEASREVSALFEEIRSIFAVPDRNAGGILGELISAADNVAGGGHP